MCCDIWNICARCRDCVSHTLISMSSWLDSASNQTSSTTTTASKRKCDELSAGGDCSLEGYESMNKEQRTSAAAVGGRSLSYPTFTSRCRAAEPDAIDRSGGVQFFVRMIGGVGRNTVIIRGMNPSDKVAAIHSKIEAVTGIPWDQQRLIYQGRQLEPSKSLAECNITKDATLDLSARLRSLGHPRAWRWVDSMVSAILQLCREGYNPSVTLKEYLVEYLSNIPFKLETKAQEEEDKEKQKEEDNNSSTYLDIFLALSAPTALVTLYLSSEKPNKLAADDCIKFFIQSVKGYKLSLFAKPNYHKFAPIVLEFCKLLRSGVGNDDPLYDSLRSCLGGIVETFGLEDFKLSKNGIGVQDVFPFVSELAAKLSHDLASMTENIGSFGPSDSHVRDFVAFMQPYRKIFNNVDMVSDGDDGQGSGGAGSVQYNDSQGCGGAGSARPFADGIKFLRSTFYDLMGKMDLCLERLEEHLAISERSKAKGKGKVELHPFYTLAWCRFLTILRELDGISKVLKRGANEFFWSKISRRKAALSNLVVRFAKREENNEWISQHKDVIDFPARRHLALLLLPEMKDEYEELHEMLIDRSHLLAESFAYIANADTNSLRRGLFMEFKDEEATGPGVLREWFLLVCQEIFNPQNALFVACPNDRRRFFPNSASKVDPMHLDYYRFAGRIIALALIHKIQVGIVFDRVFTLQLAGKGISIEDIQDADPYLYNSCKQILAMDPDAVDQDVLCLTFVREIEELGSRKAVELCPDGQNIAVNSRNRKKYVDLLIEHRFVISISDQINKFKDGFSAVVNSTDNTDTMTSFFRSLDPDELNWVLHGSESAISVEDWKAHTEYSGYKKSDPQIVWFWKAVGKMSAEQKKILLFFWTSIKHLPMEGFGGLASSLYIYKTPEPQEHLPSSHTCFFRLCFPPYSSMAMMKDRLSVITQEHVGCSFGTW